MGMLIDDVKKWRQRLKETWDLKLRSASEGNDFVVTTEVVGLTTLAELLYYAEIGMETERTAGKRTQ